MAFGYDEAFGSYSPEAYERLLLDAILGEPTLFIRRDEVEGRGRLSIRSRRVGRKARRHCRFTAPGSWGPEEADRLLEDEGRAWQPLGAGPKPAAAEAK